MTWLGKILAFLVFLGALVWAWFTVSVYATRTNWKNQADKYKVAYEEAIKARESEKKLYDTERDALNRQVATANETSKGLADNLTLAKLARDKAVSAVSVTQSITKGFDVNNTESLSNLRAALDELDKVRARSNALEDSVKDLTIARAVADRDRQGAENLARQAQAERLLAERKVEDLIARITEMRSGGAGVPAIAGGGIPGGGGGATMPVPEGLRGTVLSVGDDHRLVVVSVGIDAGLTQGSKLDIYRQDGGNGKYIGTVTIDTLQPKMALGVFTPADVKRTIKSLKPDELPQVKDTVGKVGGTR